MGKIRGRISDFIPLFSPECSLIVVMIFVGFGIFDHFGPEAIGLNLSFFANLVDITVNEFAVADDDFAIDDGVSDVTIIFDDAEISGACFDGTAAIFDGIEGTAVDVEEVANQTPAAVEAVDFVDGIIALCIGFFLGEIELDVHIAAPAIDAEGDFLGIAEIVRPANRIAVIRAWILDEPCTGIGDVTGFFG